MASSKNETEKKYAKSDLFIYIFLLPIVFTLALTGILLTFLDVPVVDKLHRLAYSTPFIKDYVPEPPKEAEIAESKLPPDERIEKLKSEAVTAEKKIADYQKQLEDSKKETETLSKTLSQMKSDQKASEAQAVEDQKAKELAEAERKKQLNDLAKVYSTMSPSKSAPILETLDQEQAALILNTMKVDERANVLSKMSPEKAGELSLALKDIESSKDADISALQNQIKDLTTKLEQQTKSKQSTSEFSDTVSKMPDASASQLIADLMVTDETKALAVMSALPAQKRSTILSSMIEQGKSSVTPENPSGNGMDVLASKISRKLIQ